MSQGAWVLRSERFQLRWDVVQLDTPLPPDRLARAVWTLASGLDPSEFHARIEAPRRGWQAVTLSFEARTFWPRIQKHASAVKLRMIGYNYDVRRAASNALRRVDRATGRPSLIAARVFSWTRIGVAMPDAAIRGASATSFQRGQMKNARSFFFAITACSRPMRAATPGAPDVAAAGAGGRLATSPGQGSSES